MFRITGLAPDPFRPLFALTDAELAARSIRRMIADRPNSFPDRISLQDAAVGDEVLLLNYCYQPAATPYRGTHAIFVNATASEPFDAIDTIPPVFRSRLLSLRAFDRNDMMIDADVIEGTEVAPLIARQLGNADVRYIQVHFAKRGCFAARIDRD